MGYVVVAVAATIIVVVVVRIQIRDRRMQPLRAVVNEQDVSYQIGVDVKYRTGLGWSRKTLLGMKLIVRSHSIQVTLGRSPLARSLGSDWTFEAAKTTMCKSRSPSSRFRQRDWIILSGMELEKKVELAISETEHTEEVWEALAGCGVQPTCESPVS